MNKFFLIIASFLIFIKATNITEHSHEHHHEHSHENDYSLQETLIKMLITSSVAIALNIIAVVLFAGFLNKKLSKHEETQWIITMLAAGLQLSTITGHLLYHVFENALEKAHDHIHGNPLNGIILGACFLLCLPFYKYFQAYVHTHENNKNDLNLNSINLTLENEDVEAPKKIINKNGFKLAFISSIFLYFHSFMDGGGVGLMGWMNAYTVGLAIHRLIETNFYCSIIQRKKLTRKQQAFLYTLFILSLPLGIFAFGVFSNTFGIFVPILMSLSAAVLLYIIYKEMIYEGLQVEGEKYYLRWVSLFGGYVIGGGILMGLFYIQ